MALFPLEDFAAAPAPPAEPAISEDELEAARRTAYENGFQAGAADAIAAAEADQARIGAALAARVQELGFTYQEAAAHVMSGVEPVLRAMVETLMPPLMAETVGRMILHEVRPLAEEAADIPVRVLVSPDEAAALRGILGENTPVPMAIVEDASLSAGQAHLRLGQVERQIDLSAALDRITQALAAVTDLSERSLAHA